MGKQKKDFQPTRRQVLGMLGTSMFTPMLSNPLRVLVAGIVDGLIMKSQAMAAVNATLPPRNYVFIGFAGGPMRVHFDCPLTPYTNQAVVANSGVVTRWTSASSAAYTSTAFTRGGNTVNMPHLWNCSLPTAAGGSVPMANLLDNMLMIRGINNGSDGHALNYFKTTRPVNQSSSIDGAVADRSNMAIPSASLLRGNSGAFKSKSGVAPSMMPAGANPLQGILSAFDQSKDGLNSGFQSRQLAMDSAFQQAMQSLGNYAKSGIPGTENLYTMRTTVEKVVRAGIGDLASAYNSIYQKYVGLMRAVATSPIPGITDTAISLGSFSQNGFRVGGATTYVGSGFDPRTMVNSNTNISLLAENFAVAEYLLVNGYTNSINMGSSSIFKLNFANNYNEWILDEHSGGGNLSMIANAFMWRVVATFINEFANVLKSKNLWKETVIHLGGDFGRNPNKSGVGSEHGWMANSVSLISGAVTKPYVIGNTHWNGSPYADRNVYTGTWGAAAPTMVDGQAQELTLGHVASTICGLLRVESPTPNNNPLFTEQNGGTVVPLVEPAKNV
ncbi:MAG: DUF1501 domain-containing protein [Bdellovibrionota bacterium]